MKAWVITTWRLDGRRSGVRVIGIVSARRGIAFIERHVQDLYVLLFLSLTEQMEFANYSKPLELPKVKVAAGVDVYLFTSTTASVRAQKSEIVGVRAEGSRQWLKWRTPRYERWSQHPKTYQLKLDSIEESKIVEAERTDFRAGFRW